MDFEILDDNQFAKQASKLVKFHVSTNNANMDRLNAAFLQKLENFEDSEEKIKKFSVKRMPFNNKFNKGADSFSSGSQSAKSSVSSKSKSEVRQNLRFSLINKPVENSLWNCDTELEVKDMLISTTKKSQMSLEVFQKKLNQQINTLDAKDLSQMNNKTTLQSSKGVKATVTVAEDLLESRSDFSSDDMEDNGDIFHDADAKKAKKQQLTKLQQVKDLYQKNLHTLLTDKQQLEKSLRIEQTLRAKYEEEVKYLQLRLETEMKVMRQKIEDEFKSSFSMRQNSMWAKFQDEMSRISHQYFDIKQYNNKKDQVIFKLCKAMAMQENDISTVKLQLKSAQRENKLLQQNPSKIGLLSTSIKSEYSRKEDSQRKVISDTDDDAFDEERIRYQEHIQYMDEELETLKKIMENWISELESTNLQLQEMRNLNERMRVKHKLDFDEMVHHKDTEATVLKNQVKILQSKLNDFEEHMKGELALKEEIDSRQQKYIDMLKNEVVTAKMILGNQRLRETAFKEINYDSVFYYDYKPKTAAEGKLPEKFDPQKVNIVAKKAEFNQEPRQIFSSSQMRRHKDDSILNLNYQRPITQGHQGSTHKNKLNSGQRRQYFDQTTVASTNQRRKISLGGFNHGFTEKLEEARAGTAKNSDRITIFKSNNNQSIDRYSNNCANNPNTQTLQGWANNQIIVNHGQRFKNKSMINSLEQSIEVSDYNRFDTAFGTASLKPKRISTQCQTPKQAEFMNTQQTSKMANAFYNIDNSILSQQ